MHFNNDVHEPVIDAFAYGYSSPEDVIKQLGGSDEAKRVLGRLWNCSDILPGDIIDYVHSDWPEAGRMEGNFGALARWMIRYMEQ